MLIAALGTALLVVTSVLLLAFGLNLLHLAGRAARLGPAGSAPAPAEVDAEPPVCVQLPIYNERYVAERVLDAACGLDWPPGRLEIQVLDDSDDGTPSLARRIEWWRRRGRAIAHVRRATRQGYKAGALAHGLTLTDAPFVAIFDADFVPPPDFLRRTMPAFTDPRVGFVQARWGHLDAGYSWFTRLQALAIDFHFLVEQAVRASRGYLTNFTGTAGVWRRAAIDDAGGWSARTLTEDLDLSYRAQLRGWRAAYVEDVVVPEELPVSIDAYRRQQSRWATGSFQCAFLLLGPVLRSPLPRAVKLQAAIHLLSYGVGPLMLLQLLSYPAVLLATAGHPAWPLAGPSALVVLVSAAPWAGFTIAQVRLGRPWRAGLGAMACQVIGAGMSLTVLIALFRSLRPGGAFERTPKHRIVGAGQEWRHQAYVRSGDPRAALECVLGVGALGILALAAGEGQWLTALYSGVFAAGLLLLSGLTAADLCRVLAVRHLGPRARGVVARAAAPLPLLAAVTALLLAGTLAGEPFEDGYAHWLMAAGLAATGHLRDPLFGMEDTWLPGYQLLAAAVLKVFGLWQLGALKALGALLGAATLACVYALGGGRAQGWLAVGLLALNPVFLYTSGTAVAEPLLTLLLTVAALMAARGRFGLAALAAALACLTGTKAWIWAAAAVAVTALGVLGGRSRLRRPLWVLAAAVAALAIFLQLGFAPVGNSIGRGSLEVASATARGSIRPGAAGRLAELGETYALVLLPLLVPAALGVRALVREGRSARRSAVLRLLHAPALAYLALVFALVGAGAYSGSHRYLYPALPALALLAAAGLAGMPAAVRAAALAGSALLAIAFLPVFASFAAGNAGLAAAGRTAARAQGALLTDSPVVAYHSHKPPAQITGSRSLPAGRAAALAWIREHGVSEVVVEDISYYRATAVFPELAAGRPSAPFEPDGDQGAYRAPGGKAVHAYAVRGAGGAFPVAPAAEVSVAPAEGAGKTAPLARGLVLRVAGRPAVGEGMGFGVPIAHYPDGWIYPGTARTVEIQGGWARTFELDVLGGDAAHGYAFAPTATRGSVVVTYRPGAGGVAIEVRPLGLAPGYTELAVLNEQSAAFDDLAAAGRPALTGPAFGPWMAIEGPWARLRSGRLGVEWSVPALGGAELRAGRELVSPALDWAGLDYLFPAPFAGAVYRVNVQEAR